MAESIRDIGAWHTNFGGVDMPVVKGGIKFRCNIDTLETTADPTGTMARRIYVTGGQISLECPYTELTQTQIRATSLFTGVDKMFTIPVGTDLTELADELILRPYDDGEVNMDPDEANIFLAIPVPNFENMFGGTEQRVWTVTYRVIAIDAASNDFRIWGIGLDSIPALGT